MKVFRKLLASTLVIFRFDIVIIIRLFFINFIFFDNEKYPSSYLSPSSVLSLLSFPSCDILST